MGKCLRCGISGAFVKTDEDGFCVLCRTQIRSKTDREGDFAKNSARVRSRSEGDRIVSPEDFDPEATVTRYLSTPHDTYPSRYRVEEYYKAEFLCILHSLPRAEVGAGGVSNYVEALPEYASPSRLEALPLVFLGNFVAVDTETTGLGRNAKIVEIGAVRFRNFRPEAAFSSLCRPPFPIPLSATKIHGIRNADVADAPRFCEILPSFVEFTRDLPLAAHNARFDTAVLAGEGFPFNGRTVWDTLTLARAYLRDRSGEKLQSYRLTEACRACAILFPELHRADSDALAAGLLFAELVKRAHCVSDLTNIRGDSTRSCFEKATKK